MTGTILFEYDTDNDIIVATPKWHIITQEDCEELYNNGLIMYQNSIAKSI